MLQKDEQKNWANLVVYILWSKQAEIVDSETTIILIG